MRVSIRKSDGRIMESQSGDGDLDALIANAAAAGVEDADISVMDDAAFAVLLQAQNSADAAALAPKVTAEDILEALKSKGIISDDEVTDMRMKRLATQPDVVSRRVPVMPRGLPPPVFRNIRGIR